MGKTHYFILGNGFSINLIKNINCGDKIDLSNLFKMGDKVSHPDDEKTCFLSRRYCPDLWGLGARSTMSTQQSNELIRDIITSTNVYYLCSGDFSRQEALKQSTYYKAYCQLISYLKNLFIYYNNLVTDDELIQYVNSKPSFISYIEEIVKRKEIVRIITYNYDIFLERMLKLKNIEFKIAAFDEFDDSTPIVIFKPHGSISFESKTKRVPGQKFNWEKDPIVSATEKTSNMENNFNIEKDNSNINPIIPPAGDGDRVKEGWCLDIKKHILASLEKAKNDDLCVIYGISYDHVDRRELDSIITHIPWDINISYINPFPSSTFDMVLGSIFKNYSHYKDFYMEEK